MKISIIGTKVCPDISSKLSFCAWNINGLSSKCIGSKLQNPDFLNVIDNCDFILLTEIGNCTDLEITGYKSFVQCSTPNQSRKGGRNSGGIALLFKNKLDKNILIKKSTQNYVWFTIKKDLLNSMKDIHVCGIYIPPCNSKYFDPEIFDQLEQDIIDFSPTGSIILMGDFNSRTGKYSDTVSQEGNNVISNDQSESAFQPAQRNSFDNVINSHGKRLLEICKNLDLRIIVTLHMISGTKVIARSQHAST